MNLLKESLELAIHFYIQEIKTGKRQILAEEQLKEFAELMASQGDAILFKEKPGKNRLGTAKMFNVFAESIANLAFYPGGVEIFGLKFEEEEKE